MMRPALFSLLILVTSCGRIGFESQGETVGTDEIDAGDVSSLVLAAPVDHLNFNSSILIQGQGGQPPYTYEKIAGAGTLDAEQGIYHSSGHTETAVLRVTDQAGFTAELSLPNGGQQLFMVGGREGLDVAAGYVDTVWRSTDGGVQWDLASTLPARVGNPFVIVVKDAIYVMGGRTDNFIWHGEVWRSVDGVTWTQIGQLPEARAAVSGTDFIYPFFDSRPRHSSAQRARPRRQTMVAIAARVPRPDIGPAQRWLARQKRP